LKVFESSTGLRDLLARVRVGEPGAGEALFTHCLERIKVLSHRLFQSRKDLQHFEESDDLLQKTLVRLHRAIQVLKPETTRAFMSIALQNMRWALRDLSREMHSREIKIEPNADLEAIESKEGEPSTLLEWANFHEAVELLPAEERETFDLIYYGGHNQDEVAEALGISARTVKRRWRLARLLLAKALKGNWPTID
jgi:RNA polymerase sigma factor (sigma-70 family)